MAADVGIEAKGLKKPKRELKPKTILHFRPHGNWAGEYGFDWIRVNDVSNKGNDHESKEILGKYINTGCTKKWSCPQIDTCINPASNPNKKCLETSFLNNKRNLYPSPPSNGSCRNRPQIQTECSDSVNCLDATTNVSAKCINSASYVNVHLNNTLQYCSCGAACFSEVLNPSRVCQDINSWSTNFQKDVDPPSNREQFRELQNYFDHEFIDGFGNYRVPILTLMPDKDNGITLKVLVTIKDAELKEDLMWVYNDRYFYLTPPVINKSPSDIPQVKEFAFKCKDPFPSDEYICVYYHVEKNKENEDIYSLCGKLKILSNHPSKRTIKDVVLVRVNGDIGNGPLDGDFSPDSIKTLEDILRQGYVFLKKNDDGSNIIINLNISEFNYEDNTGETRNRIIDNHVIKGINGSESTIKKDSGLLTSLNEKINGILNGAYSNYFKVYSINGRCVGAGGFSGPGTDSCVVFRNHKPEFVPHELLHSFQLEHTFVAKELRQKALITYEAKKTDNIMDYSHLVDIKIIDSFYWQWKLINPNLHNEV